MGGFPGDGRQTPRMVTRRPGKYASAAPPETGRPGMSKDFGYPAFRRTHQLLVSRMPGGAFDMAAMARVFRDFRRGLWRASGVGSVQPVYIQAIGKSGEIHLTVRDGGRIVLGEIEVVGGLVGVGAPEELQGIGIERAQGPADDFDPRIVLIRNGRPENAIVLAVGRDG